jgi:hypothetical protein
MQPRLGDAFVGPAATGNLESKKSLTGKTFFTAARHSGIFISVRQTSLAKIALRGQLFCPLMIAITHQQQIRNNEFRALCLTSPTAEVVA